MSPNVDQFRRLSNKKKLAWLAELQFKLTISARDTYVPNSDRVERPEQLRVFNEVMHRIADYQMVIARNPQNAMPPEKFFEILDEFKQRLGFDSQNISKD